MSDELTTAELTYLELTAKHSPHELPSMSGGVLRLLQELQARENQVAEMEQLQARIDDLENEVGALEEEKRELEFEIEDIQEKLDAALAEHI